MQSKVDDARREYESSTEKLHALKKKTKDEKQDKVTKVRCVYDIIPCMDSV